MTPLPLDSALSLHLSIRDDVFRSIERSPGRQHAIAAVLRDCAVMSVRGPHLARPLTDVFGQGDHSANTH